MTLKFEKWSITRDYGMVFFEHRCIHDQYAPGRVSPDSRLCSSCKEAPPKDVEAIADMMGYFDNIYSSITQQLLKVYSTTPIHELLNLSNNETENK